MASIPLPDCTTYWGGCDPAGVDLVLRRAAGLFGYGPAHVFDWLFLLLLLPIATVLLVDPLPETWREVGKRLAYAFLAVAAVGHFDTALGMLVPGFYILIFVAAVGVVVWLAYTISTRSYQLANNLRNHDTDP